MDREDDQREHFRRMDEGAQPPPGGNGVAHDDRHEVPRPLHREIPPGDPFPVEALGPALRSAAEAIHQIVQAPLAICGQAVLGTAVLATQSLADVELPYGDVRPLSIYCVVVGLSGERKSAVDSFATRPITTVS